MADQHQRLMNRIRRAQRQRDVLRGSTERAIEAFKPSALGARAKRNVAGRVKAADKVARAEINKHRVPLVIAAVGGLLFALRNPIREYGPGVVRRIKGLADDVRDRFDSESTRAEHDQADEGVSDEQID